MESTWGGIAELGFDLYFFTFFMRKRIMSIKNLEYIGFTNLTDDEAISVFGRDEGLQMLLVDYYNGQGMMPELATQIAALDPLVFDEIVEDFKVNILVGAVVEDIL